MDYTIDVPQDFNVTNQVNFLKQAGQLATTSSVIAHSISYTANALEFSLREGEIARVVNETSMRTTAKNFSPDDIRQHIRQLPIDANKTVVQLSTDAGLKRDVARIKQLIGLKTEEDAVRFALQFTHDVAKHMQQCNGKAFIAFFAGWDKRGTKMNTIFDKTLSAKFGRAGRKVKNTVKKMLPAKKAPQL